MIVEELQNGTKYDLNLEIATDTSAYALITINLPSSMYDYVSGSVQASSGGSWSNWERSNGFGCSLEGNTSYLWINDDSGTKVFNVRIQVVK